MDRIIPDGTFWTFERDEVSNKRYILIDMEKRNRVVNWRSLFALSEEEKISAMPQDKLELMKKFAAANQGLAKLTGDRPDSINDMLKDAEFLDALDDPDGNARATLHNFDPHTGKEAKIDLGKVDEGVLPYESVSEVHQAVKDMNEQLESSE